MTNKLWTLLFFVAATLSLPAIGAGATGDVECVGYLQSVREKADKSHEMPEFLAAISHPYYLLPGAWFLALQTALDFSNPVSLITHGKHRVAATALSFYGLSDTKKCAMARDLKQHFKDELGDFGGNFLLYHYTTRHSALILELIATNLGSDAD